MLYQNILLPVFVLVALTFAIVFWKSRRLSFSGGSAGTEGWFSYHLHILFYVLVGYAMTLRQADLIMVLLAWVFVVIQLLHAGLFSKTINSQTSSFFIAGVLVLLAMWVYFAIHILFPVL